MGRPSAPGGRSPNAAGGYPGIPGVGGFPLACGAPGGGPTWPLGVVGLLVGPDGVPGLPPSPADPPPPSLFLADGVEREDEERLDGGLRSPPLDPPPLPVLSLCSPLMAMGCRGGSSSLPTSTTRSVSLLSPPSDSCNNQAKVPILKTILCNSQKEQTKFSGAQKNGIQYQFSPLIRLLENECL